MDSALLLLDDNNMTHQRVRFTKSAETATATMNGRDVICESTSSDFPNYESYFERARQYDEKRKNMSNFDSLKVPGRTQSMRQPKSSSHSRSPMRRHSTKRVSNRSFKVPTDLGGSHSPTPDSPTDEDLCRLRSFTIDPVVGLINRGDSFRSKSPYDKDGNKDKDRSPASSLRSSRSHSPFQLDLPVASAADTPVSSEDTAEKFDILVIGEEGVGKSALINQFKTSEYCNLFAGDSVESNDAERSNVVTVVLDGDEFELKFIECDNTKLMMLQSTRGTLRKSTHTVVEGGEQICKISLTPQQLQSSEWKDLHVSAYLIVYSVDCEKSYKNATDVLNYLHISRISTDSAKPMVLVGNKDDLERRRYVSSEDAKSMAKLNESKFVETSVAIGHNVDKLLAGVLSQIRNIQRRNDSEVTYIEPKKTIKEKIKLCPTRSAAATCNCVNLSATKSEFINRLLFKKQKMSKSVEDLFSVDVP